MDSWVNSSWRQEPRASCSTWRGFSVAIGSDTVSAAIKVASQGRHEELCCSHIFSEGYYSAGICPFRSPAAIAARRLGTFRAIQWTNPSQFTGRMALIPAKRWVWLRILYYNKLHAPCTSLLYIMGRLLPCAPPADHSSCRYPVTAIRNRPCLRRTTGHP
jgi:hypothetical protein